MDGEVIHDSKTIFREIWNNELTTLMYQSITLMHPISRKKKPKRIKMATGRPRRKIRP